MWESRRRLPWSLGFPVRPLRYPRVIDSGNKHMKWTGHYRVISFDFVDTLMFAQLLVANGDECTGRRRQKTFKFELFVFPHSAVLEQLALGWRKIKHN